MPSKTAIAHPLSNTMSVLERLINENVIRGHMRKQPQKVHTNMTEVTCPDCGRSHKFDSENIHGRVEGCFLQCVCGSHLRYVIKFIK